MTAVADDDGIVSLTFGPDARKLQHPAGDGGAEPGTASASAILDDTQKHLRAYFGGDLKAFDLPITPRGTEFQKQVWRALVDIPYGTTTTYGKLAAVLGDANRSRAVGAASGRNPIAVIVPCHRVIGADGSLTGFAGGLAIKRFLLSHEAAQIDMFAGVSTQQTSRTR